GITLLDEFIDDAIFADGSCNLESASEGVHPADVRMEQVDGFKTLPSHMRVEVQPAGGEAACLEDRQHGQGGVIQVSGKLIGVPTEHQVSSVGVYRAEQTDGRGKLQFMLKGV